MMMNCKSAQALILVVAVSLVAGCGGASTPELGRVTGKVTLNGAPVVGVNVMASPKEGRTAFGTVGADGMYDLMYTQGVPGTRLGPNKISPLWPNGGSPPIPPEYTNLEFDVKPGRNTFNIEMKSDVNALPKKTKVPVD